MSEWTIEGDETMRWDVIADDKPLREAETGSEEPDLPDGRPASELAVNVASLPTNAVTCDGCPGDGIYRGAGYVLNGTFKGFTGTCYRCQGKGFQTEADVKRCSYYDNRIRRILP